MIMALTDGQAILIFPAVLIIGVVILALLMIYVKIKG